MILIIGLLPIHRKENDDSQETTFHLIQDVLLYPQIRSESVCSNQFNCYACVRHQIEANDALVMPL